MILARDSEDAYVALFSSPFYLKYTLEKHPKLVFEAKL